MVDIRHYLPEIEDPKSIGVTEAVYYPVLENILEENDTLEDRIAAIHRDIHDLIPKHITKEDIFASDVYKRQGYPCAPSRPWNGKQYSHTCAICKSRSCRTLS